MRAGGVLRGILGGSALSGAVAWCPPAVATGPAPRQDSVVIHACDEGAPDGWTVIEEASGASDLHVLCNYLVERLVEDVNQVFVSGIAITVEYFCTSDEATEAFLGKTGRSETRDRTTTLRTETKLVTEEGPAAKNKDNPQGDRPIFGFGPVPYDLQEKAWELLSPQIVTTTYVLTNERGPTTEEKRFGIAAAAPQVINVVNNHLPTVCAVPAVGNSTAAPTGGKGGSRTVLVSGVAGLIAIGGTIVWRRKRGTTPVRPPSPYPAAQVPPQCLQHSKAYEDQREVLLTLREAYPDMEKELHTSHRLHRVNILKANAVLGIELGTYLGGAVDDFARSVKPRPPKVREPIDNWKPPGGIDAKIAQGIRGAIEALDAARLRVNGLREKLATAASAINQLASHPLVREAQEKAAAALKSVRRAEEALKASDATRKAIDVLDDNIDTVGKAAASNFQRVDKLEKNIEQFRSFIRQAEGNIKNLTTTVDAANPLAVPANSKDLQKLRDQVEGMKRQIERDLKELAPLKINHEDSMRNLETLMGRREHAMRELAGHGDVMPKDVERLRAVHQQLLADAAATQNKVINDVSAQYEKARAALKAAQIEEGLAEAYLKGLRTQLERGQDPGVARTAVNWGISILTSPVTLTLWMFEKGFGSTQSVGEIWDVLMKGEERLEEMVKNITKIERATTQTHRKVEILQGQLESCIAQAQAAATTQGQAA